MATLIDWMFYFLALEFYQARSLLEWHTASRFCGFCGGKNILIDAGRRKQCSNELCKKKIYPRVDPVCQSDRFCSLWLIFCLWLYTFLVYLFFFVSWKRLWDLHTEMLHEKPNFLWHVFSWQQVVIMLVIDKENDRALLSRQSRFVPRMWSCLAGFMEVYGVVLILGNAFSSCCITCC